MATGKLLIFAIVRNHKKWFFRGRIKSVLSFRVRGQTTFIKQEKLKSPSGGAMYSYYKVITMAFAATTIMLISNSCTRTPAKQEKADMNLQSTRLAVIPAGQEPEELYISDDGRHLAYIVKHEGNSILVLDGKEGKSFKNISRIVFSPDCKSVAFKATDQGKQSVVVNGKSEKIYESVGTLQFTPDGRVVYEAMLNKKWFIVAGKRESPVFDMPFEMPMISPDGNKMAYIEQHFDIKKSNLVVSTLDMKKRTKGKDYDAITRIKASKTNSRFAYIVVRNSKQAVVSAGFTDTDILTESEGATFDQILTLDISDDGKHLAYLARRDKTVLLVKDGVELPFPEHEMRSQTLIGKDGRTFNAGVTKGRFFTVMDGKSYGNSYDGIKDPVFSTDGSRFAFVARNGDKHHVDINGSSTPQFDMVVAPQFSPDGSRLIYRARQDGKRFVVIADAKGNTIEKQPDYDMVWQPVITPDGKSIAYCVKTGSELWWKVEKLK